MIEFDAAQELVRKSVVAGEWGVHQISIDDALYQVISQDIKIDRDYPPFNRSAMDGIALRSSDLEKGITEFTVVDTLMAGQDNLSVVKVKESECIKIMTGADTPDYLDQVVKVEEVEFVGNTAVVNETKSTQWGNIAIKGEDFKSNEKILSAGTLITPDVINLLSVIGAAKVEVYKKPTFSIVCTGDELVEVSEAPAPFQIRNSNAYALKSLLDKYLFTIDEIILVGDEQTVISDAISTAVDKSNIVLLTGGVSMGEKDYVPGLLSKKGIQQVFHKIAVKPGKPLWFGKNENTFVFGLPGNPLSTQFSFLTSVAALVRASLGLVSQEFVLPLIQSTKRKGRFTQFIPATISMSSNGVGVTPKSINGSGDISSTLFTSGMIKLCLSKSEYKGGEVVDFYSWNYLENVFR